MIKDLTQIDKNIYDVIERPEEYQLEMCGVALEVLKDMSRQLSDYRRKVEYRIIQEMTDEEATKLQYVNIAKEDRTLTLKKGPMKQAITNPEELIKKHGFDPVEFGTYEFKLSKWSELKEKRKLGGQVKELIDKLYIEGKQSLDIK